MNKQEIEQKLDEIFSQTNYELVNNMIEDKGYIQALMKKSFNLALDLAAENAFVYQHSRDYKVGTKAPIVRQKVMISEVDKESILKYKL